MFSAIAWTVAFLAILAIGVIFGSVLIRRGGSDRVLGWALVATIAAMPILHAVGACVNDGPSMNYLGWVYWTDWGRTPEVGEVFRFVPADQPAWTKYLPQSTWVKRCVDITPEGLYVFEGDNTEWSADKLDELEPVPAGHIAGTIWAASHPKRAINWLSSEGRFENRIFLNHENPSRTMFNSSRTACVSMRKEKLVFHTVDGRAEFPEAVYYRSVAWKGNWLVARSKEEGAPDRSYLLPIGTERGPLELLIQGDKPFPTKIELFDPNTGFIQLLQVQLPHGAVLPTLAVVEGDLYVMGGMSLSNPIVSTRVYIIDLSSDMIKRGPDMPFGLYGETATVSDGKITLTNRGGPTITLVDESKWVEGVSSSSSPPISSRTTERLGSHVYEVGGEDNPRQIKKDGRLVAVMDQPRLNPTVVPWREKLVVVGGSAYPIFPFQM